MEKEQIKEIVSEIVSEQFREFEGRFSKRLDRMEADLHELKEGKYPTWKGFLLAFGGVILFLGAFGNLIIQFAS